MNKEEEQWVYTNIVKDHFMNPRNVWKKNSDFEPEGIGNVGSIACGDQMQIGITVKDGKIDQLKWRTYGCASAIASTSMVSEIAVGLTLEEAYNLTAEDITHKLGTLPDNKIHCSVLGDDGLRSAIDDYFFKKGLDNPFNKDALRVICKCKDITNRDIKDLYEQMGIDNLVDLQRMTAYGTVCGHCKKEIEEELNRVIANK